MTPEELAMLQAYLADRAAGNPVPLERFAECVDILIKQAAGSQ